MKVSRILATKKKGVVTITAEETVAAAIALLAEYNFGALVVVNQDGKLVGILSERDIVRRANADKNVFSATVGKVMTRNVVVGVPQDDVLSVVHTMTERRFRHLPIVNDDQELIGMISIGDVIKAQRDDYRGEIDTLETQILADED